MRLESIRLNIEDSIGYTVWWYLTVIKACVDMDEIRAGLYFEGLLSRGPVSAAADPPKMVDNYRRLPNIKLKNLDMMK